MPAANKPDSIVLLPYADRVRLVRERLAYLRRPPVADLPKPAAVTRAELVVAEWVAKNDKHHEAARTAHRAKLHEVQDALILGDTAKAVELLRKLSA